VVGDITLAELQPYIFEAHAPVQPEQVFYEGLITKGDLTVWLGREKHRKSNLILQFAICAALGRDFVGFRFRHDRPLKVVLIDFESKDGSLRQRINGIEKAMKLKTADITTLHANLKILKVRNIRKAGRTFPKFPFKEKQDGLEFWENLPPAMPADLYIIDPLRTLHSADENDSSIEALLSEIQRIFRGAAVVVAHHMRKPNENTRTLAEDMRAWSEGARGSSAIKAHSDVIVLQERSMNDKGEEVVHLGVFLKDGPDVDPFPLMESDNQSFFWEISIVLPQGLEHSYEALKNRYLKDRAAAAREMSQRAKVSRATAYRHVGALIRVGLLKEEANQLVLKKVAA
jgi:hypothetical protein